SRARRGPRGTPRAVAGRWHRRSSRPRRRAPAWRDTDRHPAEFCACGYIAMPPAAPTRSFVMPKTIEHIHWPEAPDVWMPYAPAIKVKGGTTVYLAGVTAAPVYHHHPHRPEEFD